MSNQFVEIPASKASISKRKLVYGFGINDANYIVFRTVARRIVRCPYYLRWTKMLARCYSLKYQKEKPTYVGCSVCEEWLLFSNFKSWMKSQGWEGMQLDKDIISPSNKIYSPSKCRFVTNKLNKLLTSRASKRGDYPQGVSLSKITGRYRAQISINGKTVALGEYGTPEQASRRYIDKKVLIILMEASTHGDKAISNGLKLHAELLKVSGLISEPSKV